MEQREFKFTCDPGHGWLLVTEAELLAVGLTERDISPYSYARIDGFSRGKQLALEEDLDAGTFIKAYERMHGPGSFKCTDEYCDHDSPVRNWSVYGKRPSMVLA